MDRAARRGHSGTGPGAITPDGCAVEVYERLPVLDEPDVYVFPDARWTQTFLSCPLSDEAFESALTQAGLAVDTYLTEDRTWVRALPVTG
ncbi:hypothetical protein ACIQMR_11190 [Streptomyces sp. NPDC091376]|uniref:hypothetical protein n=1 Tax=Streptomyces sp. NPDC091376 TaxID=3365994 RepID=UPI00380A9AC2